VQAPLIHQRQGAWYLRGPGCQAVDLVYQGTDLSMPALRPDRHDGLRDLEERLSARTLHESMTFPFNRSQADVSGINGYQPPHEEALCVFAVLHKALVEVNGGGDGSSPSRSRGGREAAPGRVPPLGRRSRMESALLSRGDRLRQILADLRMPSALEARDAILQGVDGGALTAPEAIEQLLTAQIQLRNNPRLQAARRFSRLPVVKQLHDFNFTFQPSLRREQIESLHEPGFVERRKNFIFLGPPGVGKTHMAISLAITAAQSGRRVYCGTLADLITSLEEAQAAGRLHARLRILTHPAVLVVDETGYLPISRTGSMLFFQLMTRRYERASTVLTSNKGFED